MLWSSQVLTNLPSAFQGERQKHHHVRHEGGRKACGAALVTGQFVCFAYLSLSLTTLGPLREPSWMKHKLIPSKGPKWPVLQRPCQGLSLPLSLLLAGLLPGLSPWCPGSPGRAGTSLHTGLWVLTASLCWEPGFVSSGRNRATCIEFFLKSMYC